MNKMKGSKDKFKQIQEINYKQKIKSWLLGNEDSLVNQSSENIVFPTPITAYFMKLNYTIGGIALGLLLIIFLGGFSIGSILIGLLVVVICTVTILFNIHQKNNITLSDLGILEGTIEQIKHKNNSLLKMAKERKLRKPKAIIIRCNIEEESIVERYKMPFYSNDALENMKIRVFLPLNQPLYTNTSGITVITKHWGYELLDMQSPVENDYSQETV